MTEKERNDYFYVCALIEYIARETKNHRGDIVNQIGEDGIKKLLYDAEVDHCLSFEQVSDEVVDYYKIKQGDFDTISACKYSIPSFLDIVSAVRSAAYSRMRPYHTAARRSGPAARTSQNAASKPRVRR